jgi:hypothetical protein
LLRRLEVVRPVMSVCGHIHEGRGVERVRWRSPCSPLDSDSLVESVEYWTDPGAGSKKASRLDLTGKGKGGRRLENCAGVHVLPAELRGRFGGQPDGSEGPRPQPTSSLEHIALPHSASSPSASASLYHRKAGGAIEYRSDIGCAEVERTAAAKVETAMINAAFLGPRIASTPMSFNKPIIVDVELPVWRLGEV